MLAHNRLPYGGGLLGTAWLSALTACAAVVVAAAAEPHNTATTTPPPQVTVKNGTLQGKHVSSLDQDIFLGIPFAQPPVGDLRFRNPQSLNTSWTGTQNATEYGPSCVGYGNSPAWPFVLSEDCLTLNVVRPSSSSSSSSSASSSPPPLLPLPVGVFIHGGGWTMDYAANGVYNLSFIVDESVAMGKPIMAVSLDYRLSFWGFLASQDVLEAGVTNLGLKDQRLALHWIRENIASFGGDPDQIVIWGESAGGGNVGYHATAFGGRDDGLFRGLISESGAEGTQPGKIFGAGGGGGGATLPEERYRNITEAAGCGGGGGDDDDDDAVQDKLACLRKVPFSELNATLASLTSTSFYPVVDGDMVPDYSSELLANGNFTRTPFLLGTNTDEGTLFTSATAIDTDEDIEALILATGVDEQTAATLMALYPDIDALGLPTEYRPAQNATTGDQYKRAVALSTDQAFLSFRRLRTDACSKFGVPAYSYLFESPLSPDEPSMGTPHFTEIAYVFYNREGLGYAQGSRPLTNASQAVLDLAQLTCRMWISFIHDLDPNGHGLSGVEKWPVYDAAGGYGQNFHLYPGKTGVIGDTFRLAGTDFINSVAKEQYGR